MRIVIPKEGFAVDTVSLGSRIREIRESHGLTQEELASKTGISIKHLSVLERGLKEPRLSTFLSIAEALGTTPDELLTSPNQDNEFISAILYKAARLPSDKQEKLLKIVNTLVEEL
jgi:transcriptional regulator with XRE-family HTH domain